MSVAEIDMSISDEVQVTVLTKRQISAACRQAAGPGQRLERRSAGVIWRHRTDRGLAGSVPLPRDRSKAVAARHPKDQGRHSMPAPSALRRGLSHTNGSSVGRPDPLTDV